MRTWISITDRGGRRVGGGPSFFGLIVFLAMLPLVVLLAIGALVVGLAAALAGLAVGGINRLRGTLSRTSPDPRRNVRVIRRED